VTAPHIFYSIVYTTTLVRDPELVARVRSVRGKYARTDGVSGSEELHQERQRDKAREEAKITGCQP